MTALALGVLCIDVRGTLPLSLSLQEREPRFPADEWCSAAVVIATAEPKEGEEKGGLLRQERKWHIKKKKKKRKREGVIKGTQFVVHG